MSILNDSKIKELCGTSYVTLVVRTKLGNTRLIQHIEGLSYKLDYNNLYRYINDNHTTSISKLITKLKEFEHYKNEIKINNKTKLFNNICLVIEAENLKVNNKKIKEQDIISLTITVPTLEDYESIGFKPMIYPFTPFSVNRDELGNKLLSYGVSSFGYDLRIAPEFKIFTNINNTVIDPKNFNDGTFVDFNGPQCIIPPNSFVLTRTIEYFQMPDTIVGNCLGKSTIARCGINCLVTPAEPGWSGYLTLEFANTTPLPAILYANEGGLQMQFFEGQRPDVTYSDRSGKYQNQRQEVTPPKV